MTVEANAKINLTLEVYARRPDGYHALRSLVAPISLADTLEIELSEDGSFTSDTDFEDDLCVKAARVLFKCSGYAIARNKRSGVKIRVTKRIPVGGGLGGGSADAAAVLRALNVLWKLGKSPEELAEIGVAVGSDVPALVLAQHYRQTVLMEGRGEKVSLFDFASPRSGDLPVPQSNGRTAHLILANPGVAVSTAEIFRLCTPRTVSAEMPVNDLQEPATRRHPEIVRALAALESAGATDVRMSGSGATCFGFSPDAASSERIVSSLLRSGLHVWSARILTAPLG